MKALHDFLDTAPIDAAAIDEGQPLDNAAQAAPPTPSPLRARGTRPTPLDERNAISPEAEAEFSLEHLAQGTETDFPVGNEPWFSDLRIVADRSSWTRLQRAPTKQHVAITEDGLLARDKSPQRSRAGWWQRFRKALGGSSLD